MPGRLIPYIGEYISDTHIDWPCLFVPGEIRKVSDIGGADYGHQCSTVWQLILVDRQESLVNMRSR